MAVAERAGVRGKGASVEDLAGGRVPPHSIEAEESILGGILLDNTAIDRVLEIVGPEDFYREAHRKIFEAAIELNQRNEPIDLVTLVEALRKRGDLEAVGGAAYLAELAERVPTAANVVHYARLVKDRALLRALIRTTTEIATRCYEPQASVDVFLDEAEQRIYQISENKTRGSFAHISDVVVSSMKAIDQLYQTKDMVTGVPTGFLDLDRMTAGLQPSDLIVVAGRPSMGKTAFALNIAQHAALDAGYGVAIFSLEMSKEQLVMRMLCSEARVDQQRVRAGRAMNQDYPKLTVAAGRLAEAPIYIDDTPALSVLELRAKARRLKRDPKARLGLVIVDYLQLMRGIITDSREQEISSISRSLKALAKELDIPVVALSQLNRQVESRADKRPVMADLRESGAIEQDADVILFLYRPVVYDPQGADETYAEVIVGKQRNGPTGTVGLTFLSEYTRFENRAEEEVLFAEEAEEIEEEF